MTLDAGLVTKLHVMTLDAGLVTQLHVMTLDTGLATQLHVMTLDTGLVTQLQPSHTPAASPATTSYTPYSTTTTLVPRLVCRHLRINPNASAEQA